jgi:hypothetical protein
MLFPGYEGPKEQWRAELESVNKFGLLDFIDVMVSHLDFITGGMQRESLLTAVRSSKKYGKWDAQNLDHQRMMADPTKYFDERDRRARSAKRASRARKKSSQ